MNKKNLFSLLLALCFFTSCMKDSYDKPDSLQDPNLTANYTINDLKAAYKASGKDLMTITEDKILVGIVSADDKSGNFYQEIVLQDLDNKAAIGVKIDRSNLYNDFPVGRKVYIKLKGLAVGNYNNLIQLGSVDSISVAGSATLAAIPQTYIGKSLIKGSLNNPVAVEDVTVTSLSDNHQYKLIRLKGVEFACPDTKLSYADAINQRDANRTLNTSVGPIFIRTSGYSNFAGLTVAQGNGELLAIYTVYRTDKQLKLRDLNDVKLNDSNRMTSCGSSSGGGSGGGSATSMTIQDLRAMYSGNGVKVSGKFIEGVVISDKDGKNINSQNMVVQDATGGVVVRFSSAHSYALGDKVKVTFTGDSLTKYNGLMQIFVSASNTTKTGTGTITPANVTIATINNNFSTYESTLVKISNATFTGSGTYNGSKSISDGSGSITHYTASTATFAATNIPSGAKTVTAVVGMGGSSMTKQVSIRNLTDIQ